MPRANWKGKYISFFSCSTINFLNEWVLLDPNIITRRNCFILKQFLNSEFIIYNGYEELNLIININTIGLNLSSLVLTRDFDIEHAKKQKNKKKVINKVNKQTKKSIKKNVKRL